MITGTIFIMCFCKGKEKKSCEIRKVTTSMRMPADDIEPDSTRTALDKEEKKKLKEASKKSTKKSKKKNKKKQKSSEASQRVSKKSKKAKKSEKKKLEKEKKMKLPEAVMDDDVKSTQRSAKTDPKATPGPAPSAQTPQANKSFQTLKSAKSVPVGVTPTAMPTVSPAAKSGLQTPVVPAQTPALDNQSPRSAPLPGSAESKGLKSMPAF